MIHSLVPSPLGELLLIGDGHHLTGLYTAEHVRIPTIVGDRSDREFAFWNGTMRPGTHIC